MYLLIAFVLLARIFISLVKIKRIIKANHTEELNGVHFVNTNEPSTPFSFFRWLFWNNKIELSSEKGQQIFRHEIFHIQQKHSWDVLFIEMINMIFWINPFFHLIKKELRTIHEFLADQFAVKEEDKWNYAELLLMQALQTKQHLVNPFFHNQIKRRIAMITNPQKTSHRYLRKLLVLPLTVLVIMLVAFTYKNKTTGSENALTEPITIVIDAGHGGANPGVKSPDKKYTEDQIVLDLAKTIKEISGEYNINVVLTREDENFPGNATDMTEGFKKRIEITKKVNAEVFVSIHMSAAGEKLQNNRSGFHAYISSKKEDPRNLKLASSILQTISGIYNTDLVIKKQNQQGIYVLDQNVCPAVLLECGYINNPKDVAFITERSNQEKIAKEILKAIVDYKRSQYQSDLPAEKDKAGFYGTIKAVQIDPASNDRSSTITVNGKEFNVKELKIEDMEDTRIEAIDISAPNGLRSFADTSKQPLIVIDGVKQKDNNGFKNLDPNSIESINVYKDKTAIGKYGDDGKNGVIEIITKNNPNKESKKLDEVTVIGYAKKDIALEKVEIEPAFPGGANEWRKYLERNLNPNTPIDNKAPKGNYTVVVEFIVNKDGSIRDIKALTNHGYGMEEEAVKVIKNGPNWLPAIQNGKKVNAYRKQPITFSVIEDEYPGPAKGPTLDEVVVVGYASDSKKGTDPALQKADINKLSSIYPNPVNSNLNISFNSQISGKGEIRITDAAGVIKMVKQISLIKGLNNLNINVGSLAKGIYLVNVLDANKSEGQIYKMIKK